MSESTVPLDLEQKAPIDLDSPEYYINRELSLLEFQYRVLEEAQDERNPLLERVKFLAICGLQPGRVFHGARRRSEAADCCRGSRQLV